MKFMILGIIITFALALLALVVLSTKFFYPHHRTVAFTAYAISWIPFLWAALHRRTFLIDQARIAETFMTKYGWFLVGGVVLLIILYITSILFPPQRSPFRNLSDQTMKQYFADDTQTVTYLDRRLTALVSSVESNDLFINPPHEFSQDDKQVIRKKWSDILDMVFELDLLKQRYETFYQINPLTKINLHNDVFLIGYTAHLSQHANILKLSEVITNDRLITILNEQNDVYAIPSNMFEHIIFQVSKPSNLIRLGSARAYYAKRDTAKSHTLAPIIESRQVPLAQLLSAHADSLIENPLRLLERGSNAIWFPIQKKITLGISYVRATNRNYFISPDTIRPHIKEFEPGDILVERREWHATNVGIPGYWTHAAMYTGTLKYIDEYFSDTLSEKPSDIIAREYPKVFSEYTKPDEDGFMPAIIEAKRPGVILISTEASTNADSIAVLRVKDLTKKDQWDILYRSYREYGKPYDYDFDFTTDNALVCSEVIYKAYGNSDQLTIDLQDLNGGLIFSPNNFVEKFDSEYDTPEQELDFVLFLKGNEKEKKAVVSSEQELRESHTWPKWKIIDDYLE